MDRRSERVAKRLSSRKISAPKQFVAGPASSRVNGSYFPCNFQVKSALDDVIFFILDTYRKVQKLARH